MPKERGQGWFDDIPEHREAAIEGHRKRGVYMPPTEHLLPREAPPKAGKTVVGRVTDTAIAETRTPGVIAVGLEIEDRIRLNKKWYLSYSKEGIKPVMRMAKAIRGKTVEITWAIQNKTRVVTSLKPFRAKRTPRHHSISGASPARPPIPASVAEQGVYVCPKCMAWGAVIKGKRDGVLDYVVMPCRCGVSLKRVVEEKKEGKSYHGRQPAP